MRQQLRSPSPKRTRSSRRSGAPVRSTLGSFIEAPLASRCMRRRRIVLRFWCHVRCTRRRGLVTPIHRHMAACRVAPERRGLPHAPVVRAGMASQPQRTRHGMAPFHSRCAGSICTSPGCLDPQRAPAGLGVVGVAAVVGRAGVPRRSGPGAPPSKGHPPKPNLPAITVGL